MMGAAEIAAFESETFLVMAKSGSPLDAEASEADDAERAKGVARLDEQRFEKISEIVKSFRKTCQKTGEQFYGFDAQFDGVTVVLEPLTKNTFAMVVGVDPRVGEYSSQGEQIPPPYRAQLTCHRGRPHQVQHAPGPATHRGGRDARHHDSEMRRVRGEHKGPEQPHLQAVQP